jgi:hypothetical protein
MTWSRVRQANWQKIAGESPHIDDTAWHLVVVEGRRICRRYPKSQPRITGPLGRYDRTGLGGRPVVALAIGTATLATPSSGQLTFTKRQRDHC